MLSKFTFHADLGSGEEQLFPVVDDLVFTEERDREFGFFRRNLLTELVFKGEDFEKLYDLELAGDCERYEIEIRYDGNPYYTGFMRFKTQNFKWDIDNCKVTVNLEPKDAYTCLFDGWDTQIEVLAPDITKYEVSILNGTIENAVCQHNEAIDGAYPDYTLYVDCLPSGVGWTVIDHYAQNNSDPAQYTVTTSYQREKIITACSGGVPVPPPGEGWVLISDDCPVSATFARALITEFDPENSFDLGGPTPNPDEIFYRVSFKVAGRDFLGNTLTIDNAVKLNDVIEKYNPCVDLNIVSNLLNINAFGSSPPTSPYTDPRTHNILVWQKSDVRRYNATDNATSGIWSFRDILRTLNVLYDAQPRIVGGDLRIEHRTYWESNEGLDLTILPFEPYIRGKHQYAYASGSIPRSEQWTFPEEVSLDFLGGPITYKCFAKDDLEEVIYPIERVNTDIGFILMNPDKVSDDGFVLAEGYDSGSGLSIVSRYIYPMTNLRLNAANAIPNLVAHFHQWNRPFIEGVFLSGDETFASAQRRKKQVLLQFKLSAEDYLTLNPDDLMLSQMGWGQVHSLRWSAKACRIDVELMHE